MRSVQNSSLRVSRTTSIGSMQEGWDGVRRTVVTASHGSPPRCGPLRTVATAASHVLFRRGPFRRGPFQLRTVATAASNTIRFVADRFVADRFNCGPL